MAKQRRQKRQHRVVATLSPATIKGGAVLALSPAVFQGEAIKGGSGAAEYAIGVFGNTDAQHAVTGSNMIQMQDPEAMPAVMAPSVTGGNNQNNKIGGQGILTDVAVPALLLYANNTFKRKNSKKLRKSIRKRKSKRYTRGKR